MSQLFLEFVCVFCLLSSTVCNPIANYNFNEHIREFSLNDNNSTNAKTLHKVGFGQYANFAVNNPGGIKFSDNAVAGSSQGRGFSYEHPGNGIHAHDETPYYDYGHDYHTPIDHGVNGFQHHNVYYEHELHGHGHGSHNHHVNHSHHALAAKAFIWPLAGIALLGAAAALISNPVLLQLGVATGKRKRRDADTEPDVTINWLKSTPKTCIQDASVETDQNNLKKQKPKIIESIKDVKIKTTPPNSLGFIKIPTKSNYLQIND